MDALVPAFIAALLAGVGDRHARLAALLGARSGVIAGLVLGHALAIGISVAGAWWIAPLLSPNAKALLLAIALILGGIGALWPRKPIVSPNGGFVIAATGGFVGGDATAFLTFALAVKGSAPLLAGAGALAGALLLSIGAAAMGRDWERFPPAWLGRVAGIVLIVTGLIIGLGGLRLI